MDQNKINRGVFAVRLADLVYSENGEAYFNALIEGVRNILGLARGFVYSIDNYNGSCRNLLATNHSSDSENIDNEVLDLSIAELILNKGKDYSIINFKGGSHTNSLGESLGATSLVTFPLHDSENKISGLIIFASETDLNLETDLIDIVKDQIPRASAELERLQIKRRLVLLEQDYKNLVEFTLDVIWEADLSGQLTNINGSSVNVYGLTDKQMSGRPYTDFMTDKSAAEFAETMSRIGKGESLYNVQSEHISKDNEIINVSYTAVPKYDDSHNIIGVFGSTRDISSSVRAKEIIKNNSEMFSSILARLPVIFFRVDRNGYLIDIRGSGLSRMGVEDMDWVGKPGYGLFIGMDEKIDSALSGSTVFFENQGTYSGVPWTFYTSMFFDSWSGYGAVGFSVDITEQKNVEEQLIQLLKNNRKLAQKLVEVQEEERRNLARELHDELGQSITAVKSLAIALNATAGNQYTEVRSLANSIIDLSGRLYEVVNSIMQRLRPDIIDGLDFNEAIRNCIVRSQLEKVGVNCGLEMQGNINDLEEVVKITIYRIVQECLTNISKHAMASNVYINIYRGSEKGSAISSDVYDKLQRDSNNEPCMSRNIIKIDICDDGIGMDAGTILDESKQANRHGLQGIKERVSAMGGTLVIKASPGKGVNIQAAFVIGKTEATASLDRDYPSADVPELEIVNTHQKKVQNVN